MSEYTISIPQWDDIIKIRPDYTLSEAELKKKKRERYIRIKQSPSPPAQQKLTQILTYIDDTEDILSTALWLGRFAIRRIAPRFIPVVGWALLATDVMTLAQKMFSILPAGRAAKRGLGEVLDGNSYTKRSRIRSVERFMRRKAGIGVFLEAAQAMETITGFGLSLGGIMGVLTDSVWGAIRSFQGAKVKIRKGRTGSLVEKALMYNFVGAGMAFLPEVLSKEENTRIILASEMAVDEIVANIDPGLDLFRQEMAESQVMPQMVPWDPLTREMLQEDGIDPDRDETPMYAEEDEVITIGEFGDRGWDATPSYLNYMKESYGETLEGTFTSMSTIDRTTKVMSWISQETNPFINVPTWDEKVLHASVERGIFPPTNASPKQFSAWVTATGDIAFARGHTTAWKGDLVDGMKRIFGRYSKEHPWTI
jgi:hypothetical protein